MISPAPRRTNCVFVECDAVHPVDGRPLWECMVCGVRRPVRSYGVCQAVLLPCPHRGPATGRHLKSRPCPEKDCDPSTLLALYRCDRYRLCTLGRSSDEDVGVADCTRCALAPTLGTYRRAPVVAGRPQSCLDGDGI